LSDVDVAIVTTSSLPARERLRLELTLETQLGSALGGDFDVRVINNAPLVVQGTVVQTGTLLYARDERTRVDFETRVRDRYFDFLPVLLFHRDAYLSAQRASLLERTAP
jgi:predicted nucleotidyltransferase